MCKFCEDYNFQKQMNRDLNKKYNCKSYHKIKVKMVDYLYTKGRDYRKAKPSTCTFGRYDINFCPVCGKKLSRKKI